MAGKKVVIPREKDIPLEDLLAGVGLTLEHWQTYLAILERPHANPEELPDATPATLEVLTERGLLRPSLERSLRFAPIPPATAFSKIMERYDAGLIQGMKAGMQLRRLMRGISEAEPELTGAAADESGIEVYVDVDRARDRSYELVHANPGRRQVAFETIYRPTSDQPAPGHRDSRGRVSARPSEQTLEEAHLSTVVIDREALTTYTQTDYWIEASERGEAVVTYPGSLPQLLWRDQSHLLYWRDPFPSRSATLVVTAPWALELARTYVQLVLALCEPWRQEGAPAAKDTAEQIIGRHLSHGLTDEQIASRTGLSSRTVGRHVAALMEGLGASTRFQAGMLLERRRLAVEQLVVAGGP